VIKKPRGRGGHSPRWAAEPEKIKEEIEQSKKLSHNNLWKKREENTVIIKCLSCLISFNHPFLTPNPPETII
jgi:hypothetical protein